MNQIILLGASNLTLSLRLVIHLLQQKLGGPCEILAAVGHGRAYGVFSQMLSRGLPGIVNSGLWPQLNSIGVLPTYALMTDIGNDILYGSAPEQILQQVEWCIEQLQRQSAQIIVTNLPMASIEDLSERRYTFYRNIFYPFCRLPRSETVSRVRAVYQGLIELASCRNFTLYEQEPVWFGPDGIHVHYWKRRAFYRDILEQFPLRSDRQGGVDESPDQAPSMVRQAHCERNPHLVVRPELVEGANQNFHPDKKEWLLTWQQRPKFAYKTLLGREIHCQQPSGRLTDGSTISKY
ncbi:hypothetical protein Nit79A3_2992 [Nitrosomonas sp. Is79A3]|uniref:hypothetical protein n=1 Tax=Nitrosomonas sp. (strain Is79A3) TaxID=261292 RepID=UPI000215C97F